MWLPVLAFATVAVRAAEPGAVLAITVPLKAPENAAVLSRNLIGYSLESDRWPDWTGIDTPNTFWINTLENIKAITGKPPKIRVGANSEDRTKFVATQTVPTIGTYPNWTATVPYPEALNNTVGPSFYTVSHHLPVGTQMTWGVNLGLNDSANAVAEAESIMAAFASPALRRKHITLEVIEAGNEPDLYRNNGLRNSSYNIAQWQTDWTVMAGNVSRALGLVKGREPGWLGPSFTTGDHGAGGWSPQQAFANGLLTTEAGQLLTVVSQHRYSGSFCTGSQALLGDLMSKKYIRGNVTVWTPDIAAVRAQGLRYWLGETNSYSCHGAPGVSNSAGAALWALDYSLQAASQSIEEVYYHHGIGFKYNFVQPIPLDRSILNGQPESSPARVQPSYYHSIIVAEATGRSGRTTIVEISIDDPTIAGYAIYDAGILRRAVFINSQLYTTTSTGDRPSVQLKMSDCSRRATLKRFAIAHADDTAGVTWGGVSYETATGRPTGRVVTERVDPASGFKLSATEAVMLTFF